MRIAQVAPLYEAVPPSVYGGIERMVVHLTDALVERGLDVKLLASAEAKTLATLVVADSLHEATMLHLKGSLKVQQPSRPLHA